MLVVHQVSHVLQEMWLCMQVWDLWESMGGHTGDCSIAFGLVWGSLVAIGWLHEPGFIVQLRGIAA